MSVHSRLCVAFTHLLPICDRLASVEAAFVGQSKAQPGLTCAHILKAQGEQNIFGDGRFLFVGRVHVYLFLGGPLASKSVVIREAVILR